MRIDVHIHEGDSSNPSTSTHKLLLHINKVLEYIYNQGERIMANFQEVSDELDRIKTAVDAVKELGKQQVDEIAKLKEQISTGSPVTQEQLDSLDSKADSILSTLEPESSGGGVSGPSAASRRRL